MSKKKRARLNDGGENCLCEDCLLYEEENDISICWEKDACPEARRLMAEAEIEEEK